MKNWNLVLAAGACAALASIASATPQETFNFAPVDTNGPNGDASNGVATHDFVGGYNVGTIRLTGSLVSVNAATYGTTSTSTVMSPWTSSWVVGGPTAVEKNAICPPEARKSPR